MNYTIRPERKEDYREVENHVETVVKLRREITPPYLTTDETVVLLSKKNLKPKDYVEIGVDAEDYYKIK